MSKTTTSQSQNFSPSAATAAERKVTMTSIAFYLHTETTAVEEIVFTGESVNAVWDKFTAEIGTSRSLAYTRNLAPQVPLVTFA